MRRKFSRTETVTHKLSRERTGFRSSVFLHVDHIGGRVLALRLSEKGKDDSTLDKLLHAIGDEATDMLNQITGQANESVP